MRGGLVGHDVDLDAAAQQLGQHARPRCRRRRPTAPAASRLASRHRRDGVVEVVGDDVEVAVLDPPAQTSRVDVDDEAHAAVERHRERLRAAHAAAAAGQRERAGEGAAEALGRHRGERLVGALQDALRADVDPRAGRHLAVHGQAELLEPAELRPRRPVAHEVGVGEQHARRPLVRPQHADRPAGLDEQRLVVRERRERPHDRVVARPVPRGPAGAAVDDEVVGPLGDVRVEVVHAASAAAPRSASSGR